MSKYSDYDYKGLFQQEFLPEPQDDTRKINRLLQEFVSKEYQHVAWTIGGGRLARYSSNPFEMQDTTLFKPNIRLLTGGGVSGPGEEFIEISCKTVGMNVLDIVEQLIPSGLQWSESSLLSLLYYLGENSSTLRFRPVKDTNVKLKVIIAKSSYKPFQYLYSQEIKIGEDLTLDLGTGYCDRKFGRYAAMFCSRSGPSETWLQLSTKHESLLVHSGGAVGFSRPEEIADLFPGDPHEPVVPDLVRMLFPEAKFFLDVGVDQGYPTFENYFKYSGYDNKINMR